MEGYFKVYRKITESQVFAHQTALKIWIWCLAKASYRERYVNLKSGKGEISVKIKAGQFLFGRFRAEEELSIDGSTIYKWIQRFASKEYSMITIKSNNQYSIISICNWEDYQQDSNDNVATKEQPMSSQVTAKGQPSNTNKKDKNIEEYIDIYPFEDFWNDYDKKRGEIEKIKSKWAKLTNQEKELIKLYIPKYKTAQPDKAFRKDPATFLNNKSWNDEIITPKAPNSTKINRLHDSDFN